MAIWNYAEDAAWPCTGADNRQTGRVAAEHLLTLGHRDIGLIFPVTDGNDRARHRLSEVLETHEAAGITVPQDRTSKAPYSVAQAKQAALDLLAGPA
ncbi:hypothetical protein [Leisingera sp.]|uniref:hypothetical protein n=1 Tax=Leisingera sp. TaxID=1879318 RepID=UPI002B2698D6|nr:hypothetical protein [Leisingera sp.]